MVEHVLHTKLLLVLRLCEAITASDLYIMFKRLLKCCCVVVYCYRVQSTTWTHKCHKFTYSFNSIIFKLMASLSLVARRQHTDHSLPSHLFRPFHVSAVTLSLSLKDRESGCSCFHFQ